MDAGHPSASMARDYLRYGSDLTAAGLLTGGVNSTSEEAVGPFGKAGRGSPGTGGRVTGRARPRVWGTGRTEIECHKLPDLTWQRLL